MIGVPGGSRRSGRSTHRPQGEEANIESPQARIARSFLALASGDALARIIAFGASVVVARRLGAELYGTVVFATAVLLYFQNIAQCGIDLLGVRHIAEDEARIRDTAPAILAVRTGVSIVLAALLAAGALAWLEAPDGPVLALYALTLLAIGPNAKWIFLGLERAQPVAVTRSAGEACLLLVVVAPVHEAGDLTTVPVAQAVGDGLATVAMLYWLRRSGFRMAPALRQLREQWPEVRRVFVRAAPLVANVLLGLTIYNSDLLFLRLFADRETVGYYGAAYQLVSFLNNLAMAYSLSLLPALTRVAADVARRDAMVSDSMAQVLALGLPVAVGGALLADQIIALVFGEAFTASAAPLALLVFCIPFIVVKEVHLISLIVHEREGTVMRMTAIAVLVNLVLNLALIPRFGMLGAAAATVTTEAARAAIAGYYARNEGYRKTPLARHWRVLVSSAVMGAVLMLWSPTSLFLGLAAGVLCYVIVLTAVGGIRWRGFVPVLEV